MHSESRRNNNDDTHQKRNGDQNNGINKNQRPAPSRHMKLNRLTPSSLDGPSHGGGMFGTRCEIEISDAINNAGTATLKVSQ